MDERKLVSWFIALATASTIALLTLPVHAAEPVEEYYEVPLTTLDGEQKTIEIPTDFPLKIVSCEERMLDLDRGLLVCVDAEGQGVGFPFLLPPGDGL